MRGQAYYPPLGITKEQAAEAYMQTGSIEKAAQLLGCVFSNLQHHIHRSGCRVKRYNGAFKHVRTPNGGIVRVRLEPLEQPKDTVPPPRR